MKALWADGGTALGAWLSLPDTATAEMVARTGWDYCCVDMQHGYADYRTAVQMLQVDTAVVPAGPRQRFVFRGTSPGSSGACSTRVR